jgi:hypothetical protein
MYSDQLKQDILNGVPLLHDSYEQDYKYPKDYTMEYELNDKMGAILLSGKTLIISIRGTAINHLEDFQTDGDVIPLALSGANYPSIRILGLQGRMIRIHRGGFEKYQSINTKEFTDTILALKDKNAFNKVILYGHSMGCWITSLLANDVQFLDTISTHLVTQLFVINFAPPKLSYYGFENIVWKLVPKYINKKSESVEFTVKQFCSSHDIVPAIPLFCNHIYPLTEIGFNFPALDELANHTLENFTQYLLEYFNDLVLKE